jgi:hypothetical protein
MESFKLTRKVVSVVAIRSQSRLGSRLVVIHVTFRVEVWYVPEMVRNITNYITMAEAFSPSPSGLS